MSSVTFKTFPTKEFCWFTTDQAGNTRYYRSEGDMLSDSSNIIMQYLDIDNGWQDAVEDIYSGKITKKCFPIDVVLRSDVTLDDDEVDELGRSWAGFERYSNYAMLDL